MTTTTKDRKTLAKAHLEHLGPQQPAPGFRSIQNSDDASSLPLDVASMDASGVTPPSYGTLSPLPSVMSPSKLRASNPLFQETLSGQHSSIADASNQTTNESGLYAPPYPIASSSSAFWDSDTPACFSRGPPSHLRYPAFDTIYLVSKGKNLDKGFPLAAPPLESYANHSLDAHPFISHDVTETDWILFIHAVQIMATLTDRDIRRSQPMIIGAVPLVNQMTAYGIQQFIRGQKAKKVIAAIEMWNRHFFGPRRMRIALVRGRDILTPWNTAALATCISSLPKDQLYRLFVISLTDS